MNCRIPRIIESLNASCARGLTKGISARASPRHPPNTPTYLLSRCVRVKVAIRMGPRPSLGAGRLGWLKCREFGRRGRTTSDQVIIRVQTRKNSNVRRLRHPVGSKLQSRSPSPSLPGVKREGKTSRIRPLIRKDYPLSLSISLSGGEETNQDFPSNGERTGKSPA